MCCLAPVLPGSGQVLSPAGRCQSTRGSALAEMVTDVFMVLQTPSGPAPGGQKGPGNSVTWAVTPVLSPSTVTTTFCQLGKHKPVQKQPLSPCQGKVSPFPAHPTGTTLPAALWHAQTSSKPLPTSHLPPTGTEPSCSPHCLLLYSAGGETEAREGSVASGCLCDTSSVSHAPLRAGARPPRHSPSGKNEPPPHVPEPPPPSCLSLHARC